jgi:hypothetical protein
VNSSRNATSTLLFFDPLANISKGEAKAHCEQHREAADATRQELVGLLIHAAARIFLL